MTLHRHVGAEFLSFGNQTVVDANGIHFDRMRYAYCQICDRVPTTFMAREPKPHRDTMLEFD